MESKTSSSSISNLEAETETETGTETTRITWYRGRVVAVPSGDSLTLAALEQQLVKTISLSFITAPKLGESKGVADEPFGWESREFLRKLLIGEDVIFKVDFTSLKNRQFCTVVLGGHNVACLLVSLGLAKVKRRRQQEGEVNPYLQQLLRFQLEAKQQRLGQWSTLPGSFEASTNDSKNLNLKDFLIKTKGSPIQAIVELVKDGSTIKAYLLPCYQFIQLLVAGIQAPCSRRREFSDFVGQHVISTGIAANGEASAIPGAPAPLSPTQKYATIMPPPPEMISDEYGREAKHFTEMRVLHRDVCVVIEGVDKSGNLIGSVYYYNGDSFKSLAIDLLQNGLARYVDWSANLMGEDVRRQLKSAEIIAKKHSLRIWTNFVPPATSTKPIHNQDFAGTVVEVVSGDFIIVADDAAPYGSPSAERRVHLSSLRCPKIGNLRRDESPAPYAIVAKEFLRSRLIGHQVYVSMEFTRKINPADEEDSRKMDFGSVFLCPSKVDHDSNILPSLPSANWLHLGTNVAEMVIARGFGVASKHSDFEERSHFYEALVKAEEQAIEAKRGIHSCRDPPVVNNKDLVTAQPNEAKEFFPYLKANRRQTAIVEHVFSGHRFKLLIPKEACSIAFSFSWVRSPGRDELYTDEAIALMRRRILQREVEVVVQAVDNKGTFLGMLWEGKTNMAMLLLEAGLARIQTGYVDDRLIDDRLVQAEKSAKQQKLKIWENYVEGQEGANVSANGRRQKEEMKVVVTEVLSGGKFYVQEVEDHRVASIMEKLASLNLEEAPGLGVFIPKEGDIVSAQFTADKSWNRAMIVHAPQRVESLKEEFEVFYIDYGNQEVVPYDSLRPLDHSLSSSPGLAQLCSLAYIRVPHIDEEFGEEAAAYFSDCTLKSGKKFSAQIEGRDGHGGKGKGQGNGTSVLFVTLVDEETNTSINATMLEAGLARLEKKKRWDSKEKKCKLEEWKQYQEEAKTRRLNIWQYGDIEWDDEHSSRPYRKDD